MTGAVLAMVLAFASPLEPARSAYQAGELAQARVELEALLYPSRLDSDALEAEAHLLLGATWHAQEDPSRAENEVVRGFAASAEARLDPLLFPPDFIAFAGRVRTQQQARIAELSAERRPRAPILVLPPSAATPTPSAADLALRDAPSRGWYLMPFGVGHFQHGRTTKGTVLAVSQGVTLLASAASLGTALAMRGPDGRYSAADAPTARTLNVTYLAGAYAFAALYTYGVLDGLVLDP
ncbi:hypothetical protein P2318_31650 [Myxococcaceae bacterium GXIMD 01537]